VVFLPTTTLRSLRSTSGIEPSSHLRKTISRISDLIFRVKEKFPVNETQLHNIEMSVCYLVNDTVCYLSLAGPYCIDNSPDVSVQQQTLSCSITKTPRCRYNSILALTRIRNLIVDSSCRLCVASSYLST
jgi:hypothetical protein